jgi:hypothetical protein
VDRWRAALPRSGNNQEACCFGFIAQCGQRPGSGRGQPEYDGTKEPDPAKCSVAAASSGPSKTHLHASFVLVAGTSRLDLGGAQLIQVVAPNTSGRDREGSFDSLWYLGERPSASYATHWCINPSLVTAFDLDLDLALALRSLVRNVGPAERCVARALSIQRIGLGSRHPLPEITKTDQDTKLRRRVDLVR